ncbi:hypothetical protein M407DRAFT_106904 [Tulasnella calospora MUT 4182]|uniref:Uncharacterized protein n=1 Tax=Tulasnella calospora MUT 4182 TaxID=1051891 RepID=A0A0C3KR35_9AGAM|nr:hypothetical protein M407DRAFT_106904 [Tulasnella calospora MUT 4182]
MRFFKAIIPVVAALSASLTSVIAKPVELPSSGELDVRASTLTYPDILASAQSQVAIFTPQIQKLIPFSNGTAQVNVAAVQSVLQQVNSVVVTATSQVKSLVGQPGDQIRGGKDDSTLYYATLDFVTNVGRTVAPAVSAAEQFPEIQRSIDTIDQSLTDFNNTVAECFIWVIPLIGLALIFIGAILSKKGEQMVNTP